MNQRRIIHREIEASLPRYDEWKMNPRSVRDTTGAYLEILEPAIQKYVDGLIPPERECIEYYLAGIKPHAVLGMSKVKRHKVTRADLHKWLIGNGEEWGLVNTMFKIFVRNAAYCPFCHGGPRYNGSGIHPKLSGNVCDHKERWEVEELMDARNRETLK